MNSRDLQGLYIQNALPLRMDKTAEYSVSLYLQWHDALWLEDVSEDDEITLSYTADR